MTRNNNLRQIVRNNNFFWRQTDVAVSFLLGFTGIQTIWRNLGLTFSRKFQKCFSKIQYQIMEREDAIYKNKQRNRGSETLSLAKNREFETSPRKK